MISEDSSEGQVPANNYLSLMARVGNDGPYQWVVYLITILSWASFGLINNSISLLYLDVQFDCTAFGIP